MLAHPGVAAAGAEAEEFATGQLLAKKTKTSNGTAEIEETRFRKVEFPGSSDTIDFNVPAGQTRVFQATLAGGSHCGADQGDGACRVRIVVREDGEGSEKQPLGPSEEGSAVFGGAEPASEKGALRVGGNIEPRAIQHAVQLGPGNYRFFVEGKKPTEDTDFLLSNHSFSVEAFADADPGGGTGKAGGWQGVALSYEESPDTGSDSLIGEHALILLGLGGGLLTTVAGAAGAVTLDRRNRRNS